MDCLLKKHSIKLADGKEYEFRQLPFCEDSVDIIEAISGGDIASGKLMRAFLSAIRMSLSYKYNKDQINEFLSSGLISSENITEIIKKILDIADAEQK